MSEPVLDRALLPAGCTVLCAVSGGADSVCLLDLVRRLGDVTVLCAHFDHGIRGAESARDAAFVEALCEEWGIPFFLGRGDVPAYAREHGLSLETAARELRYAFLERTAEAQGAGVIATAHNLNDNAETILFRMARGTGLGGLAGIPARRGSIVRPLLKTPRRDIEDYLAARNIPHVEDSTNAETDAARNRIRLNVLPALESIHPGAAAGIARMSETLAEDEAFLISFAEEKLALWGDAIPGKELRSLPKPVARRALARWLGGELSRERFEALLRFAAGDGAGVLELPGRRIRREFGVIRLDEERTPKLEERELLPGETIIYPGRWQISCESCAAGAEIQTSFNTFCFSCANICGKLTVASRAAGDSLVLRRRSGTRSVSKLLGEARIPVSQRDGIPVVRDGAGVLAVYGIGQSKRAFPLPEEEFYKITISPISEEERE